MAEIISKIIKKSYLWENKTPLFILDKSILTKNIQNFKRLFSGETAYSVKTNPDIRIIKTLKNKSCNFSVCSFEEILKLKRIIKDISKVIYFSPSLDKEELKKILKLGVRRISLDSQNQISLAIENIKYLKEIFIRVETGSKFKNKNFIYRNNSYLGIPKKEVLFLLQKLSKSEIKIGIHNHLSSQNISLMSWKRNLKLLKKLIEEAKKKEININSIDLGGGFPIFYTKPIPKIRQIAEIISNFKKDVSTIFPNMNIIYEPGRIIIGNTAILLTKIKQIKKIYNKNILIVDASTYNSSMDSLLVKLELPVIIVKKNKNTYLNSNNFCEYIIRGSTPDSLDIFSNKIKLQKAEVGDYIIFLNAGAYNFSSDFLSLKKPKTIFI